VPTYQYACTACGEQHEAVQAFTDAPLTDCPACGGRLRKVFSAVGVVFKGSGFYKTDSRSSKGSADAAGSGKAEGGSGKAEGASGKGEGASGKGEGASGAPSSGANKGDSPGRGSGDSSSAAGSGTPTTKTA
jgi:putative FmdB family regulatory protein